MSFVRGSQYNCTSTICYGIGDAAHKALMQLQTVVNSALKATGSSTKVTVDGKIGSGTVSALWALADRIKTPTLTNLKSAPMDSKEYITKFAPELSIEIPTALATTSSSINTGTVPRVTNTSPSVNAALDSFSSIIRQASATTHGAVPPPTNTTPPVITAGTQATTSNAMPAYTPPGGMSTGTKIALGVFGLAAVGGAGYLLFGNKPGAPAGGGTVSGARRRRRRRR